MAFVSFNCLNINEMGKFFFKAVFLSLLKLVSCQNEEHMSEEQTASFQVSWPYGVKYEIFVQSFADSNNDGIGDIPGMTAQLDYLSDLGVNGIWLMPISPSPSYHKYDVVDYMNIHPDYGTLEDFRIFVEEAHQRGIYIIVDLIVNHTSSEHPWFKQARSSKDNEYREYYVWGKREEILDAIEKKEITMDSDNITQWHENDQDETEELYYGFFHGGMPDLNFDNPKVRKEIFEIGRFWLEELKVDGFRLDAAKHIYPDDRAEDNHAWWEEFRSEMKKINPDVYLVGEVYADAATVAPFLTGLPSLFNFDMAFSILGSVLKEKSLAAEIDGPKWAEKPGQDLLSGFILTRENYLVVNPEFQDAIFLSNHDQNRSASFLGKDESRIKMAASILFTLPGLPYLYYGEEIGMPGMKPDEHIREPFIWDKPEKDKLRTRWIEPENATDSVVQSVSVQQQLSTSILNHYKDWIALRNRSEALSMGDINPVDMNDKTLVAFTRKTATDSVLVIHNLSAEQKVLDYSMDYNRLFFATMDSELSNHKIKLNPKGTVILK
jgi:glycosidase